MKHEHVYDLSDLESRPLRCRVCNEPLLDVSPELDEWLDMTAEALAGLPD